MGDEHKRGRKERNSTEVLIDECLTRFLAPYLADPRFFSGVNLPDNFARSTATAVTHAKKKKRVAAILSNRSSDELLAVFNMTKSV